MHGMGGSAGGVFGGEGEAMPHGSRVAFLGSAWEHSMHRTSYLTVAPWGSQRTIRLLFLTCGTL